MADSFPRIPSPEAYGARDQLPLSWDVLGVLDHLDSTTGYVCPPLIAPLDELQAAAAASFNASSPRAYGTWQESAGSAAMILRSAAGHKLGQELNGLAPHSASSDFGKISTDTLSAAMVGLGSSSSGALPAPCGISMVKAGAPMAPSPSVIENQTMIAVERCAKLFRVRTDDIQMKDGYEWLKYGNKPLCD